ncbi:MAG TPA: cupin domain-containing protein [Ignavibacteria bacterium]|nr:cupin domain-containing protein [Ignavibacteria bacterium]HMR39546.1 cupin domain-containing protein [Ignavibacteria bacterium]
MKSSAYWIEKFGMGDHPEGGYFKESYRSGEIIKSGHLPQRYNGDRNFSTSIYYMLRGDQYSKLHRIKSDETWHFYDGSGLDIFEIDIDGNLTVHKLGLDLEEGQTPQVLIKAGNWFGAEVNKPDSFCLAGCTVAPGFDFEDFELGNRDDLIKQFPEHKKIIDRLT